MKTRYRKFLENSKEIAFDLQHRNTINFNIAKYEEAVKVGKSRYLNLEEAKQRASCIKREALSNLDRYLERFEDTISQRGGKVLWAKDAEEALDLIVPILEKHGSKLCVKSKSMITEEIELNEHLLEQGVEVLETDLGEYIVQLAGEKPYHIVTPVMHRTRREIAELFHEKFDLPANSSPEELTLFVRNLLREKFLEADIGVTGANFLIADEGAIAITENEGNALLSVSYPKIHIAIVGVEKLVPSMKDLALLWPLLATHGTGQQITTYNSLIFGPRRPEEQDGPEEMYVILLDNERTLILDQEEQHEALQCIKCGACLNVCPIYKNIGGYTFDSIYGGPIGSILTPFFKGVKDYHHLSYACTVCGRCTENCPVNIPLHNLLLANRRDAIQQGYGSMSWDFGMKIYQKAMEGRKIYDVPNGILKNLVVGLFGGNIWGPRRKLPTLAKESFSKQWKKKLRNAMDN